MRAARSAVCVLSVVVAACSSPSSSNGPRGATSSTPASPPPSELASLERAPVLDILGVPSWEEMKTEPVFEMTFERPDEAAPLYVTPQSETTKHERWRAIAHSGSWSHTGWLTGIPPATPEVDGPNRRGYPVVQLPRMGVEPCRSPCLVDLWVWLDVALSRGQWFSLATFALEPSDRWARVVTVNVGDRGELQLFHVPA